MKILKDTFTYIGKNLIFVLGFALLPACFFAGLLKPFAITNFLLGYRELVVTNFGDILSLMFNYSWIDIINLVLAVIIFVLIFSAFLGNIENHFKSGKLNLSSSLYFVNHTVLIVLAYTIIFVLGFFLLKFALALLVFILHIVFGRLGAVVTNGVYIVNVFLTVATMIFSGVLFSYILIALVDTIMCGYSIPTSISDANDLLIKRVYTVLLFVVLPFVIVTPLVVLGGMFGFSFIANLISMLIIFMYYPVLAFTMYFNFANINRYDNIKKFYY